MKIVMSFLTAAFLASGCASAFAADAAVPHKRAYLSKRVAAPRIPPYVCNDYGHCWRSSLLKPEDYASGHLFLVNRVNRRAGLCKAYYFQYPVAWDECLGAWDHGRGRLYW